MNEQQKSPRLNGIFSRLGQEDGFSMISAVTALMVGTLLSLAAWATANSDIKVTDNDRWSRVAYQRAQSGVTDYIQHVAENSGYWRDCDQPEGFSGNGLGQTAVNDTDFGATGHTKRRWLPYASDGTADDRSYNAQYTIDLLPTSGTCKPKATAADRMINPASGTFKVRVTGRAGPLVPPTVLAADVEAWRQANWKRVSIVAEFRRTGFLDYVWFTDHEASDPELQSTAAGREGCNGYYRDEPGYDPAVPQANQEPHAGRWRTSSCTELFWLNSDAVKGPFHTNDNALIQSSGSGGADFGNPNRGDRIEVYASGSSRCSVRTTERVNPDQTSSNCLNPPAVNLSSGSTLITGPAARYLDLPLSNDDLLTYADPYSGDPDSAGWTFRGKTSITLSPNGTFTVNNNYVNGGATTPFDYPTSGVIYVVNDGVSNCASNPDLKYQDSIPVGCALLEVKGSYNKSLTMGSEADIVITGNIARANSEAAVLGLVANQYVRVRHYRMSNSDVTYEGTNGNCASSSDANTPRQTQVTSIRAAILALKRSFTVDGYGCGTHLGTLRLDGSMAQRWRGAVTSNGSGYNKDYNYDYTLKSQTPPHFLTPSAATWKVIRIRQQVPACACKPSG